MGQRDRTRVYGTQRQDLDIWDTDKVPGYKGHGDRTWIYGTQRQDLDIWDTETGPGYMGHRT
jgi:hypothetical protein